MRLLSKEEIFSAFTRKEQKILKLPANLGEIDWERIDYLGWLHPSGHLAFVVYENKKGLRGLILEKNKIIKSTPVAKMCDWCKTVHSAPGVTLFSAAQINHPSCRIGVYLCSDLQCSSYVRGLKGPLQNQMGETISLENKIARLISGVEVFFERIRD